MRRLVACAVLYVMLGFGAGLPASAQFGFVRFGTGPLLLPILRGTGTALPVQQRSELGWTIVSRVQLTPVDASAALVPESLVFVPVVERCSFGRIVRADFTRLVRSPGLGDAPVLVDSGYQGGGGVVGVRLPAQRYSGLTIEHALRGRARNMIVNEPRALGVRWPAAPWSQELALCLEPQLFVESDAPEIRALVERWTNGRPTRAVPYHLAKHLADEVLRHMSDMNSQNLGSDGFAVSGALAAARTGRGTGLDLACLLCAVYRAAGLPTRIVVCASVPEGLATGHVQARAVVEFFLPPEVQDGGEAVTVRDGTWIPVDIQAQRESSSRPPPFDQPWAHFGNGDRLETLLPLAFHFHPPVESVRVGAPALWSWSPGSASLGWRQAFSLTLNEGAIQPGPDDRRVFER